MSRPLGAASGAPTTDYTTENMTPNQSLLFEGHDAMLTKKSSNTGIRLQQGLGVFFRLPRELRDMIYSNLIADGEMAVARVSRIVSEEIRDVVFERGIYRLDFRNRKLGIDDDAWGDAWVHFFLESKPKVLNRCQHFSLSFSATPRDMTDQDWESPLLEIFTGPHVCDTCYMTLEFLPQMQRGSWKDIFIILKKFHFIRKLTVKINIEKGRLPNWVRDMLEGFDVEEVISDAYRFINSQLRTYFGKETMVKGTGVEEVVFYPRAYMRVRMLSEPAIYGIHGVDWM